MPEVTDHAPGMFWWADVMTTDAAGAKRFYQDLFGWHATDNPIGNGMSYTMFDKDGKNVCALAQMSQQMQQQVPHPFWQCYVTVPDVDAAAANAVELGGTIAMPPMDVFDAGRMASVIDPTGAAINLWQKGTHGGADIIGEPCALAWAELYTPDREKAGRFYTELLDWTIEESSPGEGGAYHVFVSNGANAAGMAPVRPEEVGIPPNWSPYFAVADCDETVAKAESLGGKLDFPPMEIPEIGRFTFLQDPQGAHFAIIQFAPSS